MPYYNSTVTQTQVAVTTSAAQVLGANPARKALTLQNLSGGDIFLNFTATATALNGYKLTAGQAVTFNKPPTNAISAIGSAAASLIIIEG